MWQMIWMNEFYGSGSCNSCWMSNQVCYCVKGQRVTIISNCNIDKTTWTKLHLPISLHTLPFHNISNLSHEYLLNGSYDIDMVQAQMFNYMMKCWIWF